MLRIYLIIGNRSLILLDYVEYIYFLQLLDSDILLLSKNAPANTQ